MNAFITIEALGFSIAIIDFVVVLYALVMALVGIKKGFIKMLFKLFGTLAVVVGSVLLAGSLSEFLIGPLGHYIENPAAEWMSGLVTESGIAIFTQPFNWADSAVQHELLPMALASMGLPGFVSGIIIDLGLFNGVLAEAGTCALIDVLPSAIAAVAMRVISFVILLILLGIALAIVKRLLTSLTEFRLFGGINKILGFIFGLAQAYIIVSIILVGLSYIPAPGILEAIQAQIDASYVTKMLAENNWIGNWLISTVLP